MGELAICRAAKVENTEGIKSLCVLRVLARYISTGLAQSGALYKFQMCGWEHCLIVDSKLCLIPSPTSKPVIVDMAKTVVVQS